jgi:hypothetical protein
MQPDREQTLDQIILNRAAMITEGEPEPRKVPSTPASPQGSHATLGAISTMGR